MTRSLVVLAIGIFGAVVATNPREAFDQFIASSFANTTREVPHVRVLAEFSRNYFQLKWDIVKLESWDLIRSCAQKGQTDCHILVPKVYSLRLESYLLELGFSVTSSEAPDERHIRKPTEQQQQQDSFASEKMNKKVVILRLDWSSYVLWY